MNTQIKQYDSPKAIAENLEKQISDAKTTLSEYLIKLEEVRTMAERSKKVREIMLKLANRKAPVESLGELSIGSLKVVVEANPLQILSAIESVVLSKQERLLTLQKAREDLKWLDQLGDTEGVMYTVVENEDIPERIMLSFP